MATEIERTFLVAQKDLPELERPFLIEQAYLSGEPCTRIRIMSRDGDEPVARLTVKGPGLIERLEFEFDIPLKDAQDILSEGLWQCALIKRRYLLGRWEIDDFSGEHEGLWLAEIELKSKREAFELPDWLGPEVTEDPRFTNLTLASDGVPDDYWKWIDTGEWNGLD